MINDIYMRNVPLEVENNILSFLYKPLPKRNRCYAKKKNKLVCKKKKIIKKYFAIFIVKYLMNL